MKSRCLILFEGSIKAKATLKTWNYYLGSFLKWANLDHDSFVSMKRKNIQDLIQDYCLYQKRRITDGEMSANSLPDMINAIFKFLKANGKKIDKEQITQFYPDKVKRGGGRAITDNEIRKLLSVSDVGERALIHMVSCTGARPEALANLKMENVEEYQDGFTKLVLYADDFKHEYFTFLTPEATEAFHEYLEYRQRRGEKITDDSAVFTTNYAHVLKEAKVMTLQTRMHRLFRISGIERKKVGSRRFDLATFGGFRKRFFTKLDLIADISESTIQVLMDHTGYLSGHYRKPTEEQIFKEYKKAVSTLSISNEWKLKEELEESKKDNVVEKDKRIADLESALKKQEIMLNAVMKKLQ